MGTAVSDSGRGWGRGDLARSEKPPNASSKYRKGLRASMSRSSPATLRTLAVLNLVVQHPTKAFSFTDVVTARRLSRATCHSILVTLAEAGYLYRRANKSYVIGPALIAA